MYSVVVTTETVVFYPAAVAEQVKKTEAVNGKIIMYFISY